MNKDKIVLDVGGWWVRCLYGVALKVMDVKVRWDEVGRRKREEGRGKRSSRGGIPIGYRTMGLWVFETSPKYEEQQSLGSPDLSSSTNRRMGVVMTTARQDSDAPSEARRLDPRSHSRRGPRRYHSQMTRGARRRAGEGHSV